SPLRQAFYLKSPFVDSEIFKKRVDELLALGLATVETESDAKRLLLSPFSLSRSDPQAAGRVARTQKSKSPTAFNRRVKSLLLALLRVESAERLRCSIGEQRSQSGVNVLDVARWLALGQ